MVNYTKKAVKGTSIVFVMVLVTSFLSYLWRVLLEGNLTKSDYGLVFALVAFFQMILVFKDLGLNSALTKYTAEFRTRKEFSKIKGSILLVFITQFLIGLFIGIIAIIFSDQIATIVFHDYADTALVSLLIKLYAVAMILVPGAALMKSCFQGFQRMEYYSLVTFIRAFSLLLFTYIFLDNGLFVIAPILAYVLYYMLPPLIYFPIFIKKVFPDFFSVKAAVDKHLTKKLFRFGIPVILTGFGGIIFTTTDTVILTLFRPLSEVGLYNIGMPTSRILWKLSAALAVVLLPLSSELWASRSIDRIGKGMRILYKYSFMLILPLSIVMFMFPEIILRIIFGGDSVAAANVIRILSIGAVARVLGTANNTILSGIGKPGVVSRITLAGAGVNLVLNILLIPVYGMEGAAATTTLTFILMFFLAMRKLRESIDIRLPWRDFASIAIAGILVSAFILMITALPFDILTKLMISLLFGSVLYVLVLLVLKTLSIEEVRKTVRRIL